MAASVGMAPCFQIKTRQATKGCFFSSDSSVNMTPTFLLFPSHLIHFLLCLLVHDLQINLFSSLPIHFLLCLIVHESQLILIMAEQVSPRLSNFVRLPKGTTYNYVFSRPHKNKPYILFLHGFPSSSYDWRHQIHFFVDAGYGVIAPDLLGYGGTEKPLELEAYRLKTMSDDIASILDHHEIEQVIAVGHDWYISLN